MHAVCLAILMNLDGASSIYWCKGSNAPYSAWRLFRAWFLWPVRVVLLRTDALAML